MTASGTYLVSDHDKLIGVISEKDLFTLQRVGLRQVGASIRNTTSLEKLKQAAQDIRQLGQNMLAQGVGAEQLTQIISTLNDLLTQRIIELELMRAKAETTWQELEFCWLALGSEGRYEQTLNTDQDNGIIFVRPPDRRRMRSGKCCCRSRNASTRRSMPAAFRCARERSWPPIRSGA